MGAKRVDSRRRHSPQLKALVLEQCAAPQASVAKVAMAHGLNANLATGIAVGTPITGRPPHRSEHAQFTHSAPTLGV